MIEITKCKCGATGCDRLILKLIQEKSETYTKEQIIKTLEDGIKEAKRN